MRTSIAIEEIIGIDHAVDVLSRDGSIEHRQLEELLTIQSFRVRATYPNDAQCIAGISPDAEGMASFHPAGRLHQLTRSLRLQKGVCAMAERESSYPGFCLLVSKWCTTERVVHSCDRIPDRNSSPDTMSSARMSNTIALLAKQRAAPLPHTALRRVRHRLCSVYTLTCATARLAKSERAGWERVSWRGPYAPLRST